MPDRWDEAAGELDIRGGCTCLSGFKPPDDDLNAMCPPHVRIAAGYRRAYAEGLERAARIVEPEGPEPDSNTWPHQWAEWDLLTTLTAAIRAEKPSG